MCQSLASTLDELYVYALKLEQKFQKKKARERLQETEEKKESVRRDLEKLGFSQPSVTRNDSKPLEGSIQSSLPSISHRPLQPLTPSVLHIDSKFVLTPQERKRNLTANGDTSFFLRRLSKRGSSSLEGSSLPHPKL